MASKLVDRRVCMFAASPHQSTKFLAYFKDKLQTQSPAMQERIIKTYICNFRNLSPLFYQRQYAHSWTTITELRAKYFIELAQN